MLAETRNRFHTREMFAELRKKYTQIRVEGMEDEAMGLGTDEDLTKLFPARRLSEMSLLKDPDEKRIQGAFSVLALEKAVENEEEQVDVDEDDSSTEDTSELYEEESDSGFGNRAQMAGVKVMMRQVPIGLKLVIKYHYFLQKPTIMVTAPPPAAQAPAKMSRRKKKSNS